MHYLGEPGNGNYGRFQAVEVIGDIAYFTTGGTWLVRYNFKKKTTEYEWKYKYFSDEYRLVTISGNSNNDLILVSAWGHVFHYNGQNWYLESTIYDNFAGPHHLYPRAGKIKNDIVVVASWLSSWAYAPVVRGYRN